MILIIAAVFAPLIANSEPLLVKMDGQWSSPLLRALTATDVILLSEFAIVAALLLVRVASFRQGLVIATWFLAWLLPLTLWPQPPARLWGAGAVSIGGTEIVKPLLIALLWVGCIAAVLIDLTALVLIPLRTRVPRSVRIAWAVAAIAFAGLLIALPVRPPMVIDYQHYRDIEATGLAESIVHAPLPYSPTDRLRDQPNTRRTAPSREHPLGTEANGADVLSRMIHASRIALSIGLISTGISAIIGVFIGGLMGYFAGIVDIIGMRLIEMFEAIPTLFLLITFVAFFGRNLYIMMTIIGLTGWTDEARYIRAEFLRLRNQDFVHAAVASGLPLRSVLFRHMLPNGIAPVLVTTSFGIASAILYESTLSFLGLGLVDEPSWGQLLNQALGEGGAFIWWIATFPGLAIFLTVFSYNLIGEAFRDALDPKLRQG